MGETLLATYRSYNRVHSENDIPGASDELQTITDEQPTTTDLRRYGWTCG